MEIELEPRVKPLSYKVKAMSRESASQKASHLLDPDLRTHWSTATNTKEWILLELHEPCLLSHIQIYNKSVLEWEIAVGLRYKPETFVKVRPRCEAPRRDMIYLTNYTPCRYVRISCLRGNPIAIFFVQLMGVSVTGLEPEFQPVVNHLLPQITSHKQDAHDMHLQLLQDITNRLLVFLPQLESDLSSFSDSADKSLRFLAMLVGPFYPILHIVNERETGRSLGNISGSEVLKNIHPLSSLTVSSNFEPRRSRSTTPFVSSASSCIIFRPDTIFLLLRKAYKEPDLGTVCRMASRILHKLLEPVAVQHSSTPGNETTSDIQEALKSESLIPVPLIDYSSLFGEEFHIPDDQWDASILNVLDIGVVEEGILHVLYACASQPSICHKLAENGAALWSALPLIQALLPALRPSVSSPGDHVDDSFTLWKQPFVQQALSQIVKMSCSALHRPLLHACAGYLSSFSPSHAKAACVLIDLCSSVLAPWMSLVVAKIDLAMELLEDLLGIIQGARNSLTRARAALKYIVLAISGHMDDILGKYKEVKHKILFLLEMLEPFLDPAIYALKSTIAFGDVSFTFMEKQKEICVVALNVIRMAVRKPGVLPSLESEWKRGSVDPSVLLSILDPRMQLPPEIDLCKSADLKTHEHEASTTPSHSSVLRNGGASKSNNQSEANGKADDSDAGLKMDTLEDISLLFATPELRNMILTNVPGSRNEQNLDSNQRDTSAQLRIEIEKHFSPLFQNGLVLDADFNAEYFNLLEDYFQLTKFCDSELRSSEFRRLALDLHSHNDIAVEGHDAAVDALLLAAECYVNPFFMMSFPSSSGVTSPQKLRKIESEILVRNAELWNASKRGSCNLETIDLLEKKRDKIVLQLLLEAAELDRDFKRRMFDVDSSYPEEADELTKLSLVDVQSTDAITLVRQNQALLFRFLIQQLKKEQHSIHEILLHCLVFLLHSATQLFCNPEDVIDIILGSAEYLSGMLTSLFYQLKESDVQIDPLKMHGIQRRWILLQKLVVASSGGEGSEFTINFNSRFRCGNLIPPTAWMQRIPAFSCSSCPLVRFLGWMAVSRNLKQHANGQLFLASDLSLLTHLLSLYADELAIVPNVINQKIGDEKIENLGDKLKGPDHADEQNNDLSFHVIYPDLAMFIPNLKKQFEAFGEDILNAVGLQLRSVSSSYVPDILSWLSDLISCPFFQNIQIARQKSSYHLKGYVAKNAKAIILCVLEAIIVEHMEAIVPEIPRLAQVLSSLCRASYCDVLFLDSVVRLLKPIMSYSLCKVSDDEITLDDDSCLNFESLCFEELFAYIRHKNDNQGVSSETERSGALTIFILASLFADLSFQLKRELLQFGTLWADFISFEETTSFHDYLCAFQTVLASCKDLLVQTLKVLGVLPIQFAQNSDLGLFHENSSVIYSQFLDDICPKPHSPNSVEKTEIDVSGVVSLKKGNYLSVEEIEDFCKDLGNLLAKLNPTIGRCWNLHHHLAEKLTIVSSQCIMYSGCLSSIVPQVQNADESSENPLASQLVDQFPVHWKIGLKGLAEVIVKLLENNHWEVSSLMLDCLLGLPSYFQLDTVIDTICSTVQKFSQSAPKLSWRMRCDKWLSLLLRRVDYSLHESVGPLTDTFIALLRHPEPEQRYVVLQHLGRLVGLDITGEELSKSSTIYNKLLSLDSALSDPQPLLSLVVSSTWDQVVLLASSDALLPLRNCAMALLMGYIPYAARQQLQSFLTAADSILHVLGNIAYPKCEGPVLWLSLALLASACLYSPIEDISLIPQVVWRNIEIIASSRIGDLEKNACEVLCRLRNEGEEAKEVLKKLLSSNPSKHVEPDFGSTRDSILQILANLTSVSSYFDMFSKKVDEEAMKIEEAEIELEIVREEYESSKGLKEEGSDFCLTDLIKGDNRLQQIKNQIQSLEKSKIKEDIVARRQKKLLLRRTRQRYLEEAALREEELMRELDSERAAEAEKEVERQRLLELERAKSRELRHSLDIEKERQTQRELQRELEQAETGVRSSRRDFSLSSHGRLRDRYRERENGRPSAEGSIRANAAGSMQSELSTSSSMATPTVVLSGSRPFSGQLPTILQSRDRPDEASSYEENFDGSRDSGDTGSVGDPDLMSALDGQSSGFSSSQRHGSRGNKSRQVMERRERDGRREGKWERKHS